MNYGVATADGGMVVHKGERMPDVTLTDATLAEIETRRDSFRRDSIVIATSMDTPEDAQIAADYDTLIAALRESRARMVKIGDWAHPDGIDAECYLCGETHGRNAESDARCPCPAHAVLGEPEIGVKG